MQFPTLSMLAFREAHGYSSPWGVHSASVSPIVTDSLAASVDWCVANCINNDPNPIMKITSYGCQSTINVHL